MATRVEDIGLVISYSVLKSQYMKQNNEIPKFQPLGFWLQLISEIIHGASWPLGWQTRVRELQFRVEVLILEVKHEIPKYQPLGVGFN